MHTIDINTVSPEDQAALMKQLEQKQKQEKEQKSKIVLPSEIWAKTSLIAILIRWSRITTQPTTWFKAYGKTTNLSVTSSVMPTGPRWTI